MLQPIQGYFMNRAITLLIERYTKKKNFIDRAKSDGVKTNG